MGRILDPNDPNSRQENAKGESGKPMAHFIGDLPYSSAAVEVARLAAKETGWKILFITGAPQCPGRIAVMTLTYGDQTPFWDCFNGKMRLLYGPEEKDWPQGGITPPPSNDPPPPRAAGTGRKFFHN